MPPKIKKEATTNNQFLAPINLGGVSNNTRQQQQEDPPQDTLAVLARLFSEVHQSSTTHSESKRKLLKMMNDSINAAPAATGSSGSQHHKLADIVESIRRITLAACATLDTQTVNRHSRFLNQCFAGISTNARVAPVLQLLHGIFNYHNAPDDKTRLHIMSVMLDLIRCLPDLGDDQTPQWFADLVEVLKLRSRDKSWQVREKALHLLTIFNLHDLTDDVTQFMFYIGAEETRTEIRKLLLRTVPAKSIYFAMIIRFLDDKVSTIRKQAWTQLGLYNWLRMEAYGARNNMAAKVAHGLQDSAKTVQSEVAIALKKWAETKEMQEKQKQILEHQQRQQQQENNNNDDNANANNNNNNHFVPHYKCTADELLDMLLIGLRNSFTSNSVTMQNDPECQVADQPTFISVVADHLFREHDARVEKRRRHRAQLQRQVEQEQKQRRAAAAAANGDNNNNNAEAADDSEDIPLILAVGNNAAGGAGEHEPLPYPLITDGMKVSNLSMWAAHCRAAVAAGKTDLEERLLPPLRAFADLLSDSIEIFHKQFQDGADQISMEEQKKLPEAQRGIRSKSGRLRVYYPCEAEIILHILIRSFMLYQEAGYLSHVDHESSKSLIDTFRRLLTTTMDPPTMFCKEAVQALFAVCDHASIIDQQQQNNTNNNTNNNNMMMMNGGNNNNNNNNNSDDNLNNNNAAATAAANSTRAISVTEPIRLALERLFNSLSLVRNYGLSMEDSETFGRYDAVRRTQLQEMRRREDMHDAAQVLAENIANDNLYMLRMMHITLEYLSARSRSDRSHLPQIIDHVIRLGREWGELDGQVREISTRALGMSCLANPSIVPTYIGLLIHNAAAPPPAAAGANNNNNAGGRTSAQTLFQSHVLEAQKKHRLASIGAAFDILCEFGAGFFKRQPHPSANNNGTGTTGEAGAVTTTNAAVASFDVQQWDRYVTTLQALCVDRDGPVRRISTFGVGKMLACNRFQNPEVLLCGMALVQLYYVSPTTADLQILQQQLQQRLISSMKIVQEKCQINHANDAFLFFLKAYSSSTPKRMKQTLEGGLLALRLLLRRARVSNSALMAATKFIRRLISITDSCSLEQVRDIDPRIAEAAKERILAIAESSATNLVNNNIQHQQQIQQLLLGGESASSAAVDPFTGAAGTNTLSLPPLQDEAGNDLFEVAKSNPVLWTLLASHSQHEVLAEFLLESIREGCDNVKIEATNDDDENSRSVSKSPRGSRKSAGGRKSNKKQQEQEQEQEKDNEEKEKDEDDEDEVKKEEANKNNQADNNIDAEDNDANTQADTLACKMLCARSLANLQLYKRDPVSVSKMCDMIARTQQIVQEKFPDVAAVVHRFGLAYAKSCGRKSLEVSESASENNSGRPSWNNNNNNRSQRNSSSSLLLSMNASTLSSSATLSLLHSLLGKDGLGGWRKLTAIARNAVDSWFYADQQHQLMNTSLMSSTSSSGGGQRRARTGSSSASANAATARYSTTADESMLNAFNVSATRKR